MTKRIFLTGIVQGVGFRPCCKKVADQMQLSGTAKNLGANAEIVIRADDRVTEDFLRRLVSLLPDEARLDQISISECGEFEGDGFTILESQPDPNHLPEIIPDVATCNACVSELKNPSDRRYRHPFISCSACGPRYSIIKALPYDRHNTLMEKFPMCPTCKREYIDPADRRLHAQTVACKDCGPELFWYPESRDFDPILSAVATIKNGGVIATRDIGGYHFVCDPNSPSAVKKLRELKLREKKPFAVMFESVEAIREYAEVEDEEERLLCSSARPIVLLEKKKDFCPEVCSDSPYIGAMLPSNPVQIMLSEAVGSLIMTSGNISGEPIITENKITLDICEKSPYLDGVLYHNRDIITSLDDSIFYVIDDTPHIMRRGRGIAPLSISANCGDKTVFAAGSDLKSCFGFYKNGKAVLSQHFGDLEDSGCAEVFEQSAAHISKIFGFTPDTIACDMHPAYFSSKMAKKLYETETVTIQHHHAHIASVMAEHGLSKVLGFALDGTGYGPDGTIWGGEALLCQGTEFTRLAHLETIPVSGGDEVSKNAAQALACFLIAAGLKPPADIFPPDKAAVLAAAIKMGISKSYTSSCGRLFDAVCALLGFGSYNEYEGQCAMALENAANTAIKRHTVAYPLELRYNNGVLETSRFVADIMQAKERGVGVYSLALGFHYALGEGLFKIAKQSGMENIALSGGTFNNRILTLYLIRRFEGSGFKVYLNQKVPCGDGGIALGQLYIAGRKE
ncbi:MAG: carbamoyltransferase HypF [Acutalibacteraceae bacterium]|nr:carbamoyltransferase HypF [Acutalibacteraceae bacterium]